MKILVVDDDPSVAEMIAEAVRTFGHEAVVALDGTEGLRLLGVRPKHVERGERKRSVLQHRNRRSSRILISLLPPLD